MTFDIEKIAPEYIQAQQHADEMKALVVKEEKVFQQVDERKRNGPSQADREANVARIKSGQPLPDIETEWRQQRERVMAARDAADIANKSISAARMSAGRKLTAVLKPDHDRLQKELFASLAKVHGVWSQLFAMKRGVINHGFWLNGLFAVDAQELLGVPSDGANEFNHLLREADAAGYCKAPRK